MSTQNDRGSSFARRFEIIQAGKVSAKGKENTLERFMVVFENLTTILSPLVKYLDNPLYVQSPFSFRRDRLNITKERALVVFNGYGHGPIPTVALTRNGQWFYSADYENPPIKMNTAEIAAKFFSQRDVFSKQSNYAHVPKDSGLDFMKDVFVHAGLMWFLREVFLTIEKCIEEKEKALRRIREELQLLSDFRYASDPLISGGKAVDMVEYSVFWHHSGGNSRSTATYLDESLLAEEINKDPRNKLHPSSYRAHNIIDYVDRIVFLARSVDKNITRHDSRDRRPPLIESELKVLQEQVDRIYK